MISRTVPIVLAAFLLSATTAMAITPAQQCQAAKLKVAGKYNFCRLVEESKALRTSRPPDYDKCTGQLARSWPRTESSGFCTTHNDQLTMEALLTQQTGIVVAALAGGARYVENGDGTVTDTYSQLMWEKKSELDGSANAVNLHDADNALPWSGHCSAYPTKQCQPTAAAAGTCSAHGGENGGAVGCAECDVGDGICTESATVWTWIVQLNTANFAGHSDWRMPTKAELDGIVVPTAPAPTVDVVFNGASCGATCTDIASAACSCTSQTGYWSGTTNAAQATGAWVTYFSNGGSSGAYRESDFAVRAVRTLP